ncbi:MAG TPA: GGDEF domain-containing protein [Clostridiales bacterium]|nr:GGDEF domain-containing protein [Clostridiales bacterium]
MPQHQNQPLPENLPSGETAPDVVRLLSARIGELEDFFSLAPDLLCVVDKEGNFIRVNAAWYDILGYPSDSLIGHRFFEFLHPDDQQRTSKVMADIIGEQPVLNFVNCYRAADGTFRFIEWRAKPKGSLIYGAARDVTRQRQIEDQLYNEKEQFRTTLMSIGDGIIATDHLGRIEVINRVAEQMTGWTLQDAAGRPFDEIFCVISEYSRSAATNVVNEALRTGQAVELDQHTLLIARDGTEIPIENSAAPIRDKAGQITGVVIAFRDFTDNREKQRQVEYLSFHDYLTGLYNRRYYEDSLNRLDTPRNWPLAILVIDINGLKLTNDAYGHATGDQLIRTVADILRRSCRTDDIIARTGGDEFVIILPQTGAEQASHVRQRITRAAAHSRLESVIISMAVGYAIKTEAGQDIHDVQKEADNQMYKDKLKFSKAMRSQTIETVLRQINDKYDHEQVHTEKVSEYCSEVARALQLSEKEINELKTVGVLHDIGKIAIPPDVLNKQEQLSHEEWEMIKSHAATGYNILKNVDEFAAFAEAVLHHHERWDGKGYPAGLKGADIPLYSRIVAIVDAFEAMTSQRPYQKTKTRDEAAAELVSCSGTQFDPHLVQVFINQMTRADA